MQHICYFNQDYSILFAGDTLFMPDGGSARADGIIFNQGVIKKITKRNASSSR